MKLRFLTAPIAVAGLLITAACGGGGADTASSSSTSAAVTSGTGTTGGAGTCSDGAVELTVLGLEDYYPTQEQLDWYTEKNPCVTFKLESVPFSQAQEKISLLGSAANPPDIITIDDPDVQSLANEGVLLPLDDYLPANWLEDVGDREARELSFEGKVYSPGFNDDVLALWYNKDMMDKAGITPPSTLEDTWTWPEARDALQACQAANDVLGLSPSRFGNGTPGFEYPTLLFLRSAGDPTAPESSSLHKTFYSQSPDGLKVEGWLNTPEAVEAATFYQSLFHGDKAISSDQGQPQAFLNQNSCATIDTFGAEGRNAMKAGKFTVGLTPLPYFKTPIVHSGSGGLAVTARSAHPEAAAKAIVDLSTGDLLARFLEARGYPPVSKSLRTKVTEGYSPELALALKSLDAWGEPRPVSPYHATFSLYVTDALRDIAYGADPKDQLDQAAKKIQDYIDDFAG